MFKYNNNHYITITINKEILNLKKNNVIQHTSKILRRLN